MITFKTGASWLGAGSLALMALVLPACAESSDSEAGASIPFASATGGKADDPRTTGQAPPSLEGRIRSQGCGQVVTRFDPTGDFFVSTQLQSLHLKAGDTLDCMLTTDLTYDAGWTFDIVRAETSVFARSYEGATIKHGLQAGLEGVGQGASAEKSWSGEESGNYDIVTGAVADAPKCGDTSARLYAHVTASVEAPDGNGAYFQPDTTDIYIQWKRCP